MARLRDENARVLADTLFVSMERWGWQYVEPDPARPSPDLAYQPQWADVPPPDLRGEYARQAFRKSKAVKRGVISGGLLMFGLMLGKYGVLFDLIALSLAAAWFLPMLAASQSMGSAQEWHKRRRQEAWNQYNCELERWRGRIAEWNQAEAARRDAADLWFPLELRSSPQRVDVFGGTPDGWSAMLCTAGSTIMEAGSPMFVVDFTEEDVTGPLCEIARLKGLPAVRQNVPANLEAARLLEGLDAEAIAELIAESVDTMRRGGEDVELRVLDVELVQAVVGRLDGNVSFRRIAAGLLVLQQGYDPDADRRLSAVEFQRIADVVDTVAATERIRNEVQFLRGVLDMLPAPAPGEEFPAVDVHDPHPDARRAGLWPSAGVSVLRTEDDNRRRRDFVDRLMAQVLLQNVRRSRNTDAGFVLVLVGADHLGQASLELLARRCRQAGIRLVLLMEHLRGDLQQLLGGSDSVTFFMRMGNAQEAALAAEHIGRGHSFLLTQLTRQRGQTDTTGSSYTTGTSMSTTTGTNESTSRSSRGWLDPPTYSRQSGSSHSLTTGESAQWSTNDSRAISTTDGETVSRVYEFSVEPTKIQSLDLTSFLFVESVDGVRRVAAGTCDPYVALMPRVSRNPAPARTAAIGQPQQIVLPNGGQSVASLAGHAAVAPGQPPVGNPYGQQPYVQQHGPYGGQQSW